LGREYDKLTARILLERKRGGAAEEAGQTAENRRQGPDISFVSQHLPDGEFQQADR